MVFVADPGFHSREKHEGSWINCMKCMDHDLANSKKNDINGEKVD